MRERQRQRQRGTETEICECFFYIFIIFALRDTKFHKACANISCSQYSDKDFASCM